jgi:hypothetical protein
MNLFELPKAPQIFRDSSGLLMNWEEFDTWARRNVPAWNIISLQLYGRSECERATLLACHFCACLQDLSNALLVETLHGSRYGFPQSPESKPLEPVASTGCSAVISPSANPSKC